MTTLILLDPDGTQDFGLFLIVKAETGIRYVHQCAGYATEERSEEGFLIPLGGSLSLNLDESRFSDCTEGWVPVTTKYGPATLVFKNCD